MRKVIDLECDLPPDEHGNPRKIPGADNPPGHGAPEKLPSPPGYGFANYANIFERDEAIYDKLENGHTMRQVAEEFGITPQRVSKIYRKMGGKPRDLLRRRGTLYDELGLDDAKLGDAALVAAMHEHPILIERPVVRAPKGTRLCRPPERLKDIL